MNKLESSLRDQFFPNFKHKNGVLGFYATRRTSSSSSRAIGLYSAHEIDAAFDAACQLALAASSGREVYGAVIRLPSSVQIAFAKDYNRQVFGCALTGSVGFDDDRRTMKEVRNDILLLSIGTRAIARRKHSHFEDELWNRRLIDGGELLDLILCMGAVVPCLNEFLLFVKDRLGKLCTYYAPLIDDVVKYLLKNGSINSVEFKAIWDEYGFAPTFTLGSECYLQIAA